MGLFPACTRHPPPGDHARLRTPSRGVILPDPHSPRESLSHPSSEPVAALIQAARAGDSTAFDALFAAVYDELRGLAHVVGRDRADRTLSTTEMVHEAYFKLLPSRGTEWEGRQHFLRVAARAMRQLLVDGARRRAVRRREGERLGAELDPASAAALAPEDLVALDDALQRLQAMSPRQASVVECRLFAGLSVEETATALDISPPTVKRDWRTARAWLTHELGAA
jgi:RNA polymerase sigma factor (TIGR02999 family)